MLKNPISFSTAKRDFSIMPKKTKKKKKKKVNLLGSKAQRRLLRHSQKQQQQQKSESASIDDFDAKDTKKQHQQSELELEFRTQNPPPKTQKKSSSGEQLDPYRFVFYDESEDEELKRLRAVHANPDDDVTMLLTQKWAPVDVDASDAMIGNAEDGFMSLEVLVDVDTREDAKKTSKTSTSKTLMTSKESKNAEEKKKDDKEAETTTSLQQQQQQSSSSLKKERMMMEERCCFDDDDGVLSKKDARILKRKARWKAKVEEAKKRKKTMKRTKETQGKSDEEKEEEEEKDIADAWVQYDLHPLLLKGVRKLGFTSPTPIQEKVLHPAIKGRMDIVGAAETGSGKTMAFGLPILQRLMQDKEEENCYEDYSDEEKPGKGKKHLRALIVTPTRELALQVAKMLADVSTYTDIQIAAIVGGMAKQKQERILKKQPEIIVATPGRLWELIRDGEKHLTNLERLTFLTLDEADRMVERGHFKELENVIKSIPEPPETRRIARSAKLTKRKQPMMTMSKKVTMNGGKEKKNEKEQEEEQEEEENEEPTTTDNRRIMARDRQTFVFSATLTVPDEVKYKLDRKKPQPSSKKVNRKIQKNGNDDNDDNEDDENAYRMNPPKELASTNTMGNLMKMVPFYGRVKLCDVSCDSAKKRVNENEKTKAITTTTTTTTTTTKVASKVHESALECTDDERDALTLYLLSAHAGSPSIVFVNAISSLRRLTALLKLMKVNAVGLHAGMQQRARLKALDRFKSNQATALIATDVAARGLDIKGVELVVHYQVPRQADAYVHRCGRTGRANQSGVSVALVTPKERSRYLAMLAAMGREKGFRLPPFPVAEETVREATKRVQLAKRIDAIVHKNEKKRADKAWKKRTAEAMDLGLDDSDDDSDDDDQDVMRFSDNEDGVEVIEDFEFYGVSPVDKNNCTPTTKRKKKKKKELTQKKLERLAEKRNATKREIALRNELDALLKLPLGATRRSALTSRKFPTREGGTRFEKTKKEHQQTRDCGSQNQTTTTSALDVVLNSSSSTLRRRHQTTTTPILESGPAAGARAGGATGARKIKTTTTQKKTTKSSSSRRY